jgi:hypothetical protein
MHFRAKPVIVEATRFPLEVPDTLNADYNRAFVDLANWCGGECIDLTTAEGKFAPRIRIITRESTLEAQPGDWIVKNADGSFQQYPAEAFEANFEVVTP